jgi:hypothetical protein
VIRIAITAEAHAAITALPLGAVVAGPNALFHASSLRSTWANIADRAGV